MNKRSILFILIQEEIEFDDNETSIEAKQKLKDWVTVNVEPEIVTLARSEGHEIISTPQYHSDLQQVEFLWV